MPLDGFTLHFLVSELQREIVGCRVEKVHQPSKDELVLHLRDRNGPKKLFLSASANSPRVHLIKNTPENPSTPPMFCMLMRKHLTSAVITDVRQMGLDRVLFIDFSATNELGDRVELSICAEIMAKHSNLILIGQDRRIIDAVKRIDLTQSSVRQILPGFEYLDPPAQDKLSLLENEAQNVSDKVFSFTSKMLSSALLSTVEGASPLICREIAEKSGGDVQVGCADERQKVRAADLLCEIKEKLEQKTAKPFILKDESAKPFDFSFMPITQYGCIYEQSELESFSGLLEEFYSERDRIDRTRQRSADLQKLLNSVLSRISRRLNNQRAELAACADKESLRINAELITAYQHTLKKGSLFYELDNYYDNNKVLRIPADPALSPSANAQKYYKEYRKAKTAEQMLATLIEQGEEELQYIDSVIDSLSRASGFGEINEIRAELARSGYLKRKNLPNKKNIQKAIDPIEYRSSDGFRILVGRNNVQNDQLSLKTAAKGDLWLHTQKIPGSHVIVCGGGEEIPDNTILEAARIAAYHSRARESANVPVDYTAAKNLKKPVGAKPGKVIYHVYNTVYVTPIKDDMEKLQK
ncbi:MAG: NFACT family protein [Clostridia bacterium]|nr:NFACT family protein [Clostridia bacterium]